MSSAAPFRPSHALSAPEFQPSQQQQQQQPSAMAANAAHAPEFHPSNALGAAEFQPQQMYSSHNPYANTAQGMYGGANMYGGHAGVNPSAMSGAPSAQGHMMDGSGYGGAGMFGADAAMMGSGYQQQPSGGMMMGEGRHRGQPIQAPNEPLPYIYSLGGAAMPFVAMRPRDTISYYMPEDIKKELKSRRAAMEDQTGADMTLPPEIDNFHTLIPLEQPSTMPGHVFPRPSIVYKAFGLEDGQPCVLRRVVGFQLTESRAMGCVEAWRSLSHVGVARVREAFTTKDFGDSSLVFSFDYYPNAKTLAELHLASLASKLFDNELWWNYAIQLTSALRAVHAKKLAVRTLDPTKILVVGKSRLVLSSTCVMDVLSFESEQQMVETLARHQQADLTSLGHVLLALACASLPSKNPEQQLMYVRTHFEKDVVSVISYLLQPGTFKTWNDIMPWIGARFFERSDEQSRYITTLESGLSKELYNGHLFRLMTKLSMVTDRPEATSDPRYKETGDRYLLVLLKHYIFHQTSASGEPFIDLSHVYQCLAKLDARSPERACLMSADGRNIMVVSYRDLARCLDKAFEELQQQQGGGGAPMGHGHGHGHPGAMGGYQ